MKKQFSVFRILFILIVLTLFTFRKGFSQVPQTINAWYNYDPKASQTKFNIGSPINLAHPNGFWSNQYFNTRGTTQSWWIDTTSAFFGTPWGRAGWVFRTNFSGIAKSNDTTSNRSFGDSAIAAITTHFDQFGTTAYAKVFDFWLCDSTGQFANPYMQIYTGGFHADGYTKYPSVEVGYRLKIGQFIHYGSWDGVNGTFLWDANSEPGHIHNLPSRNANATGGVPLILVGDSIFKAQSLYPVWYKEDTASGPNNYVLTSTSHQSNIVGGFSNQVGGGASNSCIGCTIIGGTQNFVASDNGFGQNDNVVIAGGFQNSNGGVNSFIGGGNNNTIDYSLGDGSVILGGGFNRSSAFNVTMMSTGAGIGTTHAGASAIIGGGSAISGNPSDTVDANSSVCLGGADIKTQSAGEVVLGYFNTRYTGSFNSIVPTDRIFTVANGTSKTSRANAVTVLKNGYVGIGANSEANKSDVILDLESTTRAFSPPKMTTTQKNAIATPHEGDQVYDLTLHQMSYWNGTTWINF